MGYRFSSLVRYSEIDENELLAYDAVAGYFQDCMTFHDAFSGLGTAYWREQRAMWVITSWKILMDKRPRLCDEIEVGTEAVNFSRIRGFRDFTMRDKDGKLICAAHGKFALISTDTATPVTVDDSVKNAYGIGRSLGISDAERIAVPEDAEVFSPIEITHLHLDGNHHVNNIAYLRMALELLPGGFEPKMMHVSYRKQSHLGDILTPRVKCSDHEIVGSLDLCGEPITLFCFSDEIPEEDRHLFGGDMG